MEPDESLMRRVQSGDEAALGLLLERYRKPLYGFLARRTDAAAADDLFQETWMRVARARDRYDPARRFSTWMFQIANNLCRDRARRREVERRHRETMLEEARNDPLRFAPPPLDQSLDIHRRIKDLPDRLREVLLLRYFHQLAEREIAEVVGIPQGTVKSRLHAAVRALRGQETADDVA